MRARGAEASGGAVVKLSFAAVLNLCGGAESVPVAVLNLRGGAEPVHPAVLKKRIVTVVNPSCCGAESSSFLALGVYKSSSLINHVQLALLTSCFIEI